MPAGVFPNRLFLRAVIVARFSRVKTLDAAQNLRFSQQDKPFLFVILRKSVPSPSFCGSLLGLSAEASSVGVFVSIFRHTTQLTLYNSYLVIGFPYFCLSVYYPAAFRKCLSLSVSGALNIFSGTPCSTIPPSARNTTLLAKLRANPILCVEISIVIFSSASSFIT